MSEAFVTLATNDTYAMGALVWAHSLRETGTTRQIAIMITPRTISNAVKTLLRNVFDHIEEVDVLDSGDHENLALLARPDLGVTFTKLHCWRLTRYQKAVFMDADTMVLQNIDDLFQYEELSAAPDPGWPDCFNSGVFVFKPSLETYKRLVEAALRHGSFDGGDQGLLNNFFLKWNRIPFVYNCVAQSFYSYQPAFSQFRSQIRVVHFIGSVKPWHHSVNHSNGQVVGKEGTGFSTEHLQRWWNLFFQYVLSQFVTSADFESETDINLPSSILYLIREIRISMSTQSGGSRFSWYRSRRWAGTGGSQQGFSFLRVQKPNFQPVKDRAFLYSMASDMGRTSRKICPPRQPGPIVRYFITIGEQPQSRLDLVTPDQWHDILRDEGLLDDVDEDFDEEFAWESYQALDGRLARLELPPVEPGTFPPISEGERERQYAWERYEIDYTGRDRFDSILDKINAAIHQDPPKK